MMRRVEPSQFYQESRPALLHKIGKPVALKMLEDMVRIRNFETRAEAAYQQGKIGGFFHSYIGQEAIQTAALAVFGLENWWITSYRCHALALLLGATSQELMAELYGRATGNAKGRGGSMHFYTERLLGGFGIVGGQIPIATGAAFSLKYQNIENRYAICFMGEGAVAQGAFHESLELASLWSLPCFYVIENNHWGMGTAVERAFTNERLAEEKAPAYNMKGYTFNGMDILDSYAAFEYALKEMRALRHPILLEADTERFRGHSISDAALYRTKSDLQECLLKDPIMRFQRDLVEVGWLTEEAFKALDKKCRQEAIEAMAFADQSPWPEVGTLEQDVFAPEEPT